MSATAIQSTYNYNIGNTELVIPLDVSDGDCSSSVSITASPTLPATVIMTVNQGTFVNTNPLYSLLFSSVTAADVRFSSSDLNLSSTSYTLTIDYSDSAPVAGTDQKTTSIFFYNPCSSTGIAGYPGDGDWDMTYVVGSPVKTIPFTGFSHGNCAFATTVTMPLLPASYSLADYGMTFY